MKEEEKKKVVQQDNEQEGINDFPIDVKKDLISMLTDCPSIVSLGNKEYMVKDLRYYSLYRICRLALDMKKGDEGIDDDSKLITALCTDLDAMCEIVAIVLCNHLLTVEGMNIDNYDDIMTKNDRMIDYMKTRVMCSTYEANQWAGIVIGAIKSIDLTAFFLLRKSVSMATDSLLMRKKKSEETASQFMEALSLLPQQTS